jgi:alkanesulfonate monooxygenase
MPTMLLNAFAMNCVGHQSAGLWTHSRDQSVDFTSLEYWTGLARTLERGLFDGVFLADVLGPYDVFGGSADAAIRAGAQIPVGDPMLLIPAMAAVTTGLGFGVTVSASYETPFLLARRFSTLDHLTRGRVGWNIVTSYLDSAARAVGRDRQMAHDDRYALAEDAMTLLYALWEGSWEEGAVLADRTTGRYADPARVHLIDHDGPAGRGVRTMHLCAPSPQRTPVLYQAGSSTAGRAFAARHAECVFVSGPSEAVLAPRVAAIREAAAAQGRTIRILALLTAIVADTDAQAHDRLADYRRHASTEGTLALLSGWTGVDFATLPLDGLVRHVENDAGRAALENFTRADPSRTWTVREAVAHAAIGGAGPVVVGSASTVADALARFMAATGVDGFNLSYAVMPDDFEAVVRHLVPVLQDRGLYKTSYAPGTLREKLFGAGRLLEPPHPAGVRRAEISPPSRTARHPGTG